MFSISQEAVIGWIDYILKFVFIHLINWYLLNPLLVNEDTKIFKSRCASWCQACVRNVKQITETGAKQVGL